MQMKIRIAKKYLTGYFCRYCGAKFLLFGASKAVKI